jgi:hypothetical protein
MTTIRAAQLDLSGSTPADGYRYGYTSAAYITAAYITEIRGPG